MDEQILVVTCSKCGNDLQPINNVYEMFRKSGFTMVVPPGFDVHDMDQWSGSTCMKCRQVFCPQCHDIMLHTCPDCGGEIRSATREWLPKTPG